MSKEAKKSAKQRYWEAYHFSKKTGLTMPKEFLPSGEMRIISSPRKSWKDEEKIEDLDESLWISFLWGEQPENYALPKTCSKCSKRFKRGDWIYFNRTDKGLYCQLCRFVL